MRANILVYNGVDEFDAIGPYRTLQNAGMLGADIDLALVTLEPRRQVTAAGGLRILPDRVLADAPDLLVIPGGGWLDRAPRGLRAEIASGHLTRRLKEVHQAGTTIAGVSTGTMALCAAGLLAGRAATTHHAAVKDLRAAGALVVDSRLVVARDVLTCGGGSSSVDLTLWVVQQQWGKEMANTIASDIGHSRNLDVYVACGGNDLNEIVGIPAPLSQPVRDSREPHRDF